MKKLEVALAFLLFATVACNGDDPAPKPTQSVDESLYLFVESLINIVDPKVKTIFQKK